MNVLTINLKSQSIVIHDNSIPKYARQSKSSHAYITYEQIQHMLRLIKIQAFHDDL